MNIKDLFSVYTQVNPVPMNAEMPEHLSFDIYQNYDRAHRVANGMGQDQGSDNPNMWRVENYPTANNPSSTNTESTNNTSSATLSSELQTNTSSQSSSQSSADSSKRVQNVKASNLKAYGGDRIKYWADKFAKLGFTPQQLVAVVAAMMQECGLKPKGSVEAKELAGKGKTEAGWAGAGEGAIGFTHWDLKSRMIKAYNNHPNRKGPKLSEVKSEYAKSSSRHIADLDDDDHALMVAIFYKLVLEKTKNMNFADLIGEFYLEKAGRGAGGRKGSTPAEKAFNRAKDYQATHRNLGYIKASKINGYEKAIADAKSISQKLGISMA